MKTKLIFLAFAVFVEAFHVHSQTTLSHHVDPVIIDTSGLACLDDSTGEYFDNHFARVYNLNEFGITEEFLISKVEIGLGYDHGHDDKIVIINIYTSDSENLTTAALTLVSTEEIKLKTSNLSLLTVPMEVNIPAGSIVVVETFAPADTIHYHPGFNLAGHRGTAWVKAPTCGQPNWKDVNNSDVGNQQHILINIVGTETLGIEDNLIKILSVYPNPTIEKFTVELTNVYEKIDVTIINILGQRIASFTENNTDKLNISLKGDSGIYFVTISTSEGRFERVKVIKS